MSNLMKLRRHRSQSSKVPLVSLLSIVLQSQFVLLYRMLMHMPCREIHQKWWLKTIYAIKCDRYIFDRFSSTKWTFALQTAVYVISVYFFFCVDELKEGESERDWEKKRTRKSLNEQVQPYSSTSNNNSELAFNGKRWESDDDVDDVAINNSKLGVKLHCKRWEWMEKESADNVA